MPQVELKPTPEVSVTGLWSTDDDEYPDAAGTYAVVIGVSSYRHFKGGDKPAGNTFGLGQLFSSAYSAYSFFEWLRCSYHITGSPVRKVWLLLSPTQQEAALIPHADYGAADFTTSADAIRMWFTLLKTITGATARESRALFFFSGHGIEINTGKQVLLPSDYLSETPPMLTEAISTYNLHLGTGLLAVPTQCFLLDACRTDVEELRSQNGFDGARILPEPFSGQNPDRSAPIIYATATGTSTYQSRVPQEMSFFADGLLAGLRLHARTPIPPLQPECLPNGRWVIKLPPLCEFVNNSMNQSLRAAGFQPGDPISIGGVAKVRPFIMSEVSGPPDGGGGRSGTGPSPLIEPSLPASIDVGLGGPASTGVGSVIAPPYEGQSKAQTFAGLGSVQDDNLGHESATAFFEHAELTEYDGQDWSGYPHRFRDHITRIEGMGDDYRRVSFKSPNPARWYWLRCENHWVEYGFLFPPTDRELQTVEFAIESVVSEDRLDARAVLSPHNREYVARAANLWRLYAAANTSHAFEKVYQEVGVREGNVDDVMDVLYNKWESPLAATVGSMILLRGGANFKSALWQKNLAHKIAYSSDAAIFVLQWMIQEGAFNPKEAGKCLADIDDLGIPFSSEAFAYIANLSGVLARQMPETLNHQTIDRITEFNAYTRPGSLFLAVGVSANSVVKGSLRDRLLGSRTSQLA